MQHRKEGKRKTIVIIAEGAHDCNLNPISPQQVKDVLTDRLGLDTRVTTLGHTQRGGAPAAYDRILVGLGRDIISAAQRTDHRPRSQATLQGAEAVEAVLDATPDSLSPVIGIQENRIQRQPLMDAVEKVSAGVGRIVYSTARGAHCLDVVARPKKSLPQSRRRTLHAR